MGSCTAHSLSLFIVSNQLALLITHSRIMFVGSIKLFMVSVKLRVPGTNGLLIIYLLLDSLAASVIHPCSFFVVGTHWPL